MSFIRIESLKHTYRPRDSEPVDALRGVDLQIDAGEYVVIVGANGSGKTTLARHLNALLLPTTGDVWVNGRNTRDRAATRAIRAEVGMVFQSPADQIVATVVEEDVAFGPENLAVPEEELPLRVHTALQQVGMLDAQHRAPHLLSAGQLQRVAIAGILAMGPRCLVLDEATSMLDPAGRRNVLDVVAGLHRAGMTIVTITHAVEEALCAQRAIVLSAGQIALDDVPLRVFSSPRLEAYGLARPPAVELAHRLRRRFPTLPTDISSPDGLARAIAQMVTRWNA